MKQKLINQKPKEIETPSLGQKSQNPENRNRPMRPWTEKMFENYVKQEAKKWKQKMEKPVGKQSKNKQRRDDLESQGLF